jgi:hypothetical protein
LCYNRGRREVRPAARPTTDATITEFSGRALMRAVCSAIALNLCLAAMAVAGPVGPTPYLSAADSPWSAVAFSSFYLENFEDGALNTLGVTEAGATSIVAAGDPFADSVDADDGTIDGSGTGGRSHYTTNGVAGIEYNFNAGALGGLPTHVGIVWTDLSGSADVFFDAYDSANQLLGTIAAGALNDGQSTGQTAEDRFLGWVHPGGIAQIRIHQSGSDMEVDHLQYGIVPEPAGGMLLVGACAALLGARRRQRIAS